jgi:hypothetical protein
LGTDGDSRAQKKHGNRERRHPVRIPPCHPDTWPRQILGELHARDAACPLLLAGQDLGRTARAH